MSACVLVHQTTSNLNDPENANIQKPEEKKSPSGPGEGSRVCSRRGRFHAEISVFINGGIGGFIDTCSSSAHSQQVAQPERCYPRSAARKVKSSAEAGSGLQTPLKGREQRASERERGAFVFMLGMRAERKTPAGRTRPSRREETDESERSSVATKQSPEEEKLV